MTNGTPLFECIGLMPSADRPSNTVCSFASVHDEVSAKAKSYAGKYQQFVLEYATEWEKIIRTRIDNGLKKAEEMRIELDHYQKKTESLRLAANQAMAKGKSVASSQQEKLTRNEEKLISSKQNYNRVATDLCILMEEVTERSWRDLHPLLVKCAQFDMTLANDEAKALSTLNQVVSSLKQVATEHGLSAQPRLKDLAGLKPELLSTRPGGVAGLQIEAGPTAFGTSFDSSTTAISPGSFGGLGQGGFPLQITPNNADSFARSNSVSSYHSAPATSADPFGGSMHALTISSTPAPAPTLDDAYGNFPNSTRSAPSSGNFHMTLPSPSPTATSPWAVRSSSFNDADSNYSGFSFQSAPPPPPPNMPPPPPPNMLPPLPPGGGMPQQSYGAPSPSYGGAPPPYGGYGSQPPPLPPMQQQQYSTSWSHPGQQQPQANSGYNPFG